MQKNNNSPLKFEKSQKSFPWSVWSDILDYTWECTVQNHPIEKSFNSDQFVISFIKMFLVVFGTQYSD